MSKLENMAEETNKLFEESEDLDRKFRILEEFFDAMVKPFIEEETNGTEEEEKK